MTEATDPMAVPPAVTAHAAPPTVSVVATSTSTTLVVRYDGSRPPTDLFAAWTGLGWQAPVPASPPRDAIDWSTPDPVRRTNHTIRPFEVVGTATLEDDRRRDADDLVHAALEVAARVGCRIDPAAADEIDLREGADAPSPVVDDAAGDRTSGRPVSRPAMRTPRLRRSRGAQARVRATIPTAELDEVAHVVGRLGASLEHEDDPASIDRPEEEPLCRVTVAVAASSGDVVMRCLASRSTGTPTIEIVTAGEVAGGGR